MEAPPQKFIPDKTRAQVEELRYSILKNCQLKTQVVQDIKDLSDDVAGLLKAVAPDSYDILG